jgi:ribonuclease T2
MPRLPVAFLVIFALLVVEARAGTAGDFDYYVLALSWSPTYCGSDAGRNDRDQCAPGRRYAFVVHGLWPQYERGWPQFCDSTERWVPEDRIDAMLDLMPSRKLVVHAWRKHGTCSGLDQDGYFTMTRRLRGRLSIPARYLSPTQPVRVEPERLVADFIATNRGLTPSMLSLRCGNRRDEARLAELHVCFTRAGALRPCSGNERPACAARTLILPPVR